MLVSIIIPTLNEEVCIKQLLKDLQADPSFRLVKEVLVVDGNSTDATVQQASSGGARVIETTRHNRAMQMNLGAGYATGGILYFLHADTTPPDCFAEKIRGAVIEGHQAGCFRLKFDWNHWLLNLSSWFTRFNARYFRFGDQSLFISKEAFIEIGGFAEELKLFEDHDLVSRISRGGTFKVLPQYVVTSSRKYRRNGALRLQLIYAWIYLMYSLGFSQKALQRTYRRLVVDPMF